MALYGNLQISKIFLSIEKTHVRRSTGAMPDISKKRPKGLSTKRKSSEIVKTEVIPEKKRKLDQLQHVPTLTSSTFNPLEEVDFPRGGATLTPLEKKQAENEGIRDALFEVFLRMIRLI